MRSMSRPNNRAHELKVFQRDIFYPVLESIFEGRGELVALGREEDELLAKILGDRTVVGVDAMLLRQRDLAAQRADKQAELDRKWTLIYAGCHWMAAQLSETDGIAESLKFAPTPSPDLIRRVIVEKAPLHFDGIEVS